jgi:sugar lactone lactonase YvrE
MDPHGTTLGRIVHGAPATTNLVFGGDDWKTLSCTSRHHRGSVHVNIPGRPVPTQNTSRSFLLARRIMVAGSLTIR